MDRAVVLGCPIDRLDLDSTVRSCVERIESAGSSQHVAVNAAKLVMMSRDERLAAIVRECSIVSADGQSVVWASRLLGDALPARVAGIDLMERLLQISHNRGYRVFVLGARPEVLDRALSNLRKRYPGLEIDGHHGHFSDRESSRVCHAIRGARPDILLIAMSSPRKEYWLSDHLRELDVPFAMGVGGAIDVIAGATRRAPYWMQRAGMEWLFRLLQEPRRLAWRYAWTNTQFLLLVLRELARRRAGRTLKPRVEPDTRDDATASNHGRS